MLKTGAELSKLGGLHDRGDVAGQKVISHPIRVEDPIRQKMSGCQVADQHIGLALAERLPWHQTEIDEISEPAL